MTALRMCSRGIAAGLLAAVAGCASTTPPTERMEASAGAIRAAEEVGATKVPSASLYLQLAREESDRAKTLIANGSPEGKSDASSLLQRAQADAELALALAHESDDRAAAQKAIDKVIAIRDGNPTP